jgi:hypothetical protein
MDVAHEQFAQMAFLSLQECGRGGHGFKIYLVFCNLPAKKKKEKLCMDEPCYFPTISRLDASGMIGWTEARAASFPLHPSLCV